MKQTKAPLATPSPQPLEASQDTTPGFVSVAFDMGWRLAVVVLVPIIGGYTLDQQLKALPWLTITGFILALLGMVLVMRRTLQDVNAVNATIIAESKRSKTSKKGPNS